MDLGQAVEPGPLHTAVKRRARFFLVLLSCYQGTANPVQQKVRIVL